MVVIMGLVGIALAAMLFGGDDFADDDPTPAPKDQPDIIGSRIIPIDDMINASDQAVVVFAGDTDDLIIGGAGNDYLHGGDGNDTLYGGAGDDVLHGGVGDDILYGGDGNDELYGHTGDDVLHGGGGDDQLSGGDGDDQLFGGPGDDVLMGGLGADTLFGGAGNDRLIDRDDLDRDYLNGGAGDDYLSGGPGDVLSGGTGTDTFNLRPGMHVTLTDYDPAEDIIEIEHTGEPPVLTTEKAEDGTLLLADGELIAKLTNFAEPDLTKVTFLRV